MALLILPKSDIISLTGKQFSCQVTDTNPAIPGYQIRGFANFNGQDIDRLFPLTFIEDQKDKPKLFTLRSEQPLDTYYQQAMDNVEGLSGCGAYSYLNGNTYFTGIIHTYEDGNLFTATKVLAYNQLIPADKFQPIHPVKPETNPEILKSYDEMDKNLETANSRTRDTIGNFNVPRDTKDLINALKSNSLGVIHGKPGVGKSALAKTAVSELKAAGDYTILTLSSEHLYCETLEKAFHNAGYKVSLEQIAGSPLSGMQVLLWIESFEKLIESGYTGAFNELLALMKKSKRLTVVITIREYLLQKFRINYHYELQENTVYNVVSEFNDQEIECVRVAMPELSPLLGNLKVNHLLRTPYYLDKARRIIPQLLCEEHLDEVRFKKLMWEHIVEGGDESRGSVFYDVCLKRAREMSLFTTYNGFGEVISTLVRDNILQRDNAESSNAYSPSHDILEDWALIRFIKKQKRDAPDPRSFLLSLENSPSIKRAFRLWMEEYYSQEPDAAVSFVHGLLYDEELPQLWKDELIIVSLRSNHVELLFNANEHKLLKDKGALLERVMLLLQTGCKKMNPAKQDFNELLPVGSGWDYIIDFIKTHLAQVREFRHFEFKYLKLIESWSKQLPDFNQPDLPPGAKSAAFLLEDFIQRHQAKVSGHRRGRLDTSDLKCYISILFKLTAADQELIENLILAARHPENDNERWTDPSTLTSIREYIIEGINSDQICRFFPDCVIQIASEDWAEKEKVYRPGSLRGMIHPEPEKKDFGIHEQLNYQYDFPSGYQTFFYWMFLHHSEKALDFLLPFLNKAFERNQNVLQALGEVVENISIKFKDGTENAYYGTFEYWVMYRGTTSRNRVMTSLLMALEASLLDLADKGETNYSVIRAFLRRLIKESNNVAVLGVVSSVLQAHPLLLDETSVSLLGVPSFFLWDGSRCNADWIDLRNYSDDEFEKKERIESNARSHRRKYYQGLIGFVSEYMFYYRDQNELLFQQVDTMWASASMEDIIWKKFLFDMDARKYKFMPVDQPGYEKFVEVVPGYDTEVKKMVTDHKDSTGELPSVNVVWANNAFENATMPDHNYETWKIGYDFLQKPTEQHQFMTAPGTMAAVGLRDFSDQLQPNELKWCRNTIISFGEKNIRKEDGFSLNLEVTDSGPALSGLSHIFKNELEPAIQMKVKGLIFRLLLSGLEETQRVSLEAGIAHHLSKYLPEFVINCWYGLLTYISFKKKKNEADKSRQFPHFEDDWEMLDTNVEDTAEKTWLDELVQSVIEGTILPPEETGVSLDMQTHWLLDDALRIIPWTTDLPAHELMIQQLLKLHVGFLTDPHQRNNYDFHDSRHTFIFFYPRYLLNQPVNKARTLFIELLDLTLGSEGKTNTDILDNFLYKLIKEFIRAVNNNAPKDTFWALWECLRTWMLRYKKAMLMPLFLMDLDWTEYSDCWHVLEGKNLYYKQFITEWGFNRIDASIKFLSGIAFRNFMPDSVSWVAAMLTSQNPGEAGIEITGKFVEKAFYKYGDKIKRDKILLGHFLFILDFLIKMGSPKAYMLRDELLQYK